MGRRKRCACGKVIYHDYDAALTAAIHYSARYKPHRAYPCTVMPWVWHTTTEWNKFDEPPQSGAAPAQPGGS